jgi:hypothetical protein
MVRDSMQRATANATSRAEGFLGLIAFAIAKPLTRS